MYNYKLHFENILSKLLIKKNVKNSLAYTILGLSLSSSGKKEDAEKIFLDGINNNPHSSDLHNNISNLYLGKKQFLNAKIFAKKAVFFAP